MKFNNIQAFNAPIDDKGLIYTPKANIQIRALTIYNKTSNNIVCDIGIGGKQYVHKTITAAGTEVINAIFNQQVNNGEQISITGNGLNAILTAVEIID